MRARFSLSENLQVRKEERLDWTLCYWIGIGVKTKYMVIYGNWELSRDKYRSKSMYVCVCVVYTLIYFPALLAVSAWKQAPPPQQWMF